MMRIGILGAAAIAPNALILPAASIVGIEIAAVAASSAEKANAFADQHQIPQAMSSYAQLIDAPSIDAIYNALPPSMHEHWSIAAMQSGKHVLCEKPFAMNAQQASNMVAAGNDTGCHLVEAFHYRFHPYFRRALQLLQAGAIGDIRHIRATFEVHIPHTLGAFRYDPALGGGALMDLGCYPLHWIRTLAGSEPEVVDASCTVGPSGVDLMSQANLKFSDGASAELSCSMGSSASKQHFAEVIIEGSNGRLTLENPIAPHNGNRIVLEDDAGEHIEMVSGDTTYSYQLHHFIDVVNGSEAPITGGDDALNNMKLIDRIYESGGGRTVRVG
jgi:predicted dehydrogenase